jgi:large repetitive protein
MKKFLLLTAFSVLLSEINSQNVEWTKQHHLNPPYTFSEKGISCDSQGNAYVIGTTLRQDKQPLAYISKFSSLGVLIWCDTIVMTHMNLKQIKTDAYGNSIIIGSFTGSLSLGHITLTDTAQSWTCFYAKLDSGGIFQWVWKLPYRASASDIQVLSQGESYLLGNTWSTSAVLGQETIPKDLEFIGKVNGAGSFLWAKPIGRFIGHPHFVLDGNGNYYVSGNFFGTTYAGTGSNVIYLQGSQGSNATAMLLKYDSSLTLQWAQLAYSADGDNVARAVGIDSYGNVYMAGTMSSYFNIGGYTVITPGSNMFLVKYDPLGNIQWLKHSDKSGQNICNGLHVDGDGISYVTGGISSGITTFDSYTVTQPNTAYLIKYDAAGNQVGALNTALNPVDMYQSQFGKGLAMCSDNAQYIYVAGNHGQYSQNCFVTRISKNGFATAIKEESASNACFEVFPNPGNSVFVLRFPIKENCRTYLRIRDFKGSLIYSAIQEKETSAVDLGNLATGLYLFEIISGDSHLTKRVAIRRGFTD